MNLLYANIKNFILWNKFFKYKITTQCILYTIMELNLKCSVTWCIQTISSVEVITVGFKEVRI